MEQVGSGQQVEDGAGVRIGGIPGALLLMKGGLVTRVHVGRSLARCVFATITVD